MKPRKLTKREMIGVIDDVRAYAPCIRQRLVETPSVKTVTDGNGAKVTVPYLKRTWVNVPANG